jgi:hypothetical protein
MQIEITNRIYTSKRDAILDIFLMETREEAEIIATNLANTSAQFTIGDVTMDYLIETFSNCCIDKNLILL